MGYTHCILSREKGSNQTPAHPPTPDLLCTLLDELKHSNDTLDVTLSEIGVAQNVDKHDVMLTLYGVGARRATQDFFKIR